MKAYRVIYKHTEEHRDLPEEELGFYLSLDKAREKALQKVAELNAQEGYMSNPLSMYGAMEWHDGFYTYITI